MADPFLHPETASAAGLAIFVKTPGLSPVKSRLWPALGRATAERLYRRMAAAVAASAGCLPRGALTRYWAVAEAHPCANGHWRGLPRLGQGNGDLGLRMYTVQEALRARHRAWLLTGADAVLLDARAHLRPALDWLAHPLPRVVFGPADDGGFWLVGGNVPLPLEAWQQPHYSTDRALSGLLDALPAGIESTLLTPATDLDLPSDLARVHRELSARPRLLRPQRRLLRRLPPHGDAT